jgi:hypothetical protein
MRANGFIWIVPAFNGFRMKINRLSADTLALLLAISLFMISLILNWSSFFPTLGEINPWDEAGYVKTGQELLQGKLPIFAGSPLTALLYAATNQIFSMSPFWLVHSVAAGRLIAYALIWLSAYLIGKRLFPLTTPIVILCLLLAAPFYIKMLRFPSDPLFMALAGLGLWQLLDFHQTKRVRPAVLAGVFIALSAAARNDGLVIFAVALVWLAIMVILRRDRFIVVVGFVAPFILIVGGYVLLYGYQTGRLDLGTAERTYDNFEAGQIAVYSGEEGLNAAVDAKREAQRLFGTAAENQNSVFKAILRNPAAYFVRLKRVCLELPSQIIKAYSGKWVVLLAFWTVWGGVVLLRKREWSLVLLLMLWISPFLSGFIITIFRTGHLLFPSLVVLALMAIGLSDYAQRCQNNKVFAWGLAAMLLLLLLGSLTSELVVIYATGLSVVAMLLIRLGGRLRPRMSIQPAFPLLLLLLVGIILHGPFPGIEKGSGELPSEEQALLAMIERLPEGARVIAGSPGVVFAANMTYLGLASTDVPVFSSANEFDQWMASQEVDAIYIDETLTVDNRVYWTLLQELAGGYDVAFRDQDGRVQVWIRSDQ